MRRVLWATGATANPMGQQHYEVEIQRAIREVACPEWELEAMPLASLRSPIAARRRYPANVVWRMDAPAAAWVGRAVYGRADLVHRFDLRLPPYRGREVVSIHDLAPARFDDEGSLPRHIEEGARRAIGVIVGSRWAAGELQELLGLRRTWVIPHGLTAAFADPAPATDAELASHGIRGPFIVHAGGASKRKNLAGLAEAWKHLGDTHPELSIVLLGPPHPARDAAFDGQARVVMPGRVASVMVPKIMCRACAVVVPSTYEGFGLPALEGMACGTPVVASNRTALPEVCADGALLVEPDGVGIAEGVQRVLEERDLAAALRQRGVARAKSFSWHDAAVAHLSVYEEALE